MYTHTTTDFQKKAPARLHELDALRGISAFSVMLFHFTINANKQKLGWAFNSGVTGVDIFFMISGFVVFLSISKIKNWQDFVVKRFARLYPAFWSCLLITVSFVLLFEPENINAFSVLANATMVPSYFSVEDLDGSYWTLVIELTFYFWILIIHIFKGINRIEYIGFFTIWAVIAFHEFTLFYPNSYLSVTQKVQLVNHFPLFYSGILFYNMKNKPNWQRYIPLILCSLFASFYLHDKGGRSQYIVSAHLHYLLITLFHLIFALFCLDKLRFLKFPPLLFLGKISYCLYLIHQYVGLRLISTFTDDFRINIYFSLSLSITICISIAYLVNRFVEKPCNRLIRNYYSKKFADNIRENNIKEMRLPPGCA
ncbi:acyltransferase family protein [Dyadobacter pollutisoli]|uniref:Acyltransferase n=1 Tax=Dyadobacter pollutisoli TaxID=2910158 RepID=A0A9E8NB78_9BACT|nr:acyltransferase [Dyadobacter pollutisoli]WAC11351.1 acyltransferase [Dyadobacter pollutisoli]